MKIILSICFTFLLIGGLLGIKIWQFNYLNEQDESAQPPMSTISTFTAEVRSWENNLKAIASLEAVQGVTVSSEVPGRIENILFRAGQEVKKGDLLLELSATAEEAELRALQANLDLAKLDYERAIDLLKTQTISQAEFDRISASFKQQEAQLQTVESMIEKKKIVAPFDGRLGIRLVNLGQIINAGTPIVSLQNTDQLFVNYSLPQRQISTIKLGADVRVIDSNSGKSAIATLSTINPQIDSITRNVQVQATLDNEEDFWVPGMFVQSQTILPEQDDFIVIPSAAVVYSSYGSSVYLIEKNENGQDVAISQFVRTGPTRGDFVAITKGLKEGDVVATSGAFKLRNNALVKVDNERVPPYRENPQVRDE